MHSCVQSPCVCRSIYSYERVNPMYIYIYIYIYIQMHEFIHLCIQSPCVCRSMYVTPFMFSLLFCSDDALYARSLTRPIYIYVYIDIDIDR